MSDRYTGMTLLARVAREHRGILLPLAAVLVLNLLGYLVVIAPLGRRVATVEDRNLKAAQALTSARDAYGRASGTLTGRDRAVTELRTFYTDVLPRDLTGARRLTHLRVAKMAQQAKLAYARASFSPVVENGRRLTQLKAEMSLLGSYANVRRFIHQLETAPEFVVIDSVELAEAATEGELSLAMALSTYYRTQEP